MSADRSVHAERSPSGASRWIPCPGSVALCRGLPDSSSHYADEGTAAHELAALCLTNRVGPVTYLGRKVGSGFVVDTDMVAGVQPYLDEVNKIPGRMMVECALPLTFMTGEDGAHGTADCIIINGSELVVIDLKYGRGVEVDAADNPQLMMYGAAALHDFDHIADFTAVRVMICQPRLDSVSAAVYTRAEMAAFVDKIIAASLATTKPDASLVPGEEQCRFCKAAGTCPAIRKQVLDKFESLDVTPESAPAIPEPVISDAMSKVGLMEIWCKAVRAELERRLLGAIPVAGWKLVMGKKGDRAWDNPAEVETILKKTMRLKNEQMYAFKLISPTKVEKILKPKQWESIKVHVTQTPGQPSVAQVSDKRPAVDIVSALDKFEVLTDEDKEK